MSEKPKRGFQLISPERRKEIASQGGKAAHAKGTAHKWTPEEASEAGQKGAFRRAQLIAAGVLQQPIPDIDPEKRRLISSMGGRAAHRKGTAHRWTDAEATEAGRNGGKQTQALIKAGKLQHPALRRKR